MGQIEEHLGLALPFTAIFEYPTIRLLAEHLLLLLHSPSATPIGAQVTTPVLSGGFLWHTSTMCVNMLKLDIFLKPYPEG